MTTGCRSVATVLLALLVAGGALGAELNFGGDLGFNLFDVTMGGGNLSTRDSMGNPVTTSYDTTGRVQTALTSHGFGLYWNVQLGDRVSVNALTEVGARTGATPSLGIRLGEQEREAGEFKPLSVPEANITVMLPWELQMTTGIIRPIFSEDYGMKKGYQEANRLHKSSANHYGGTWHDLGVELYKSFEPGGGFSIPTYLYLMNGEQMFGDNNSNKTLMVHIAPEFWKLRVMGSYAFGKEDPQELHGLTRYAAGLGGDFGRFWFRGEFFGGSWEGNIMYNAAGVDSHYVAKPIAYYVKAGYNFIPDKLGLVLMYDQANQEWTTKAKLGYTSGGSNWTTDSDESYTTVGATIVYSVIPGSAVMIEYNRGMWKVGDGTLTKLDFNRFTLGWRTIF